MKPTHTYKNILSDKPTTKLQTLIGVRYGTFKHQYKPFVTFNINRIRNNRSK